MSTPVVTEARAAHLQQYLDKHGITVKKKLRDKPDNFIHAFVLWFVRTFVKGGDERYTTTVGKTIYLSTSLQSDLTNAYTYMIVRHEVVHAIDYARFWLWLWFSYVFVLPAIWTMRAFWEKRGYTQNILVKWELGLPIHTHYEIEKMVERFTGRAYFWMDTESEALRVEWLDIIREIERGNLRGYYPYHEDYNEVYTTRSVA